LKKQKRKNLKVSMRKRTLPRFPMGDFHRFTSSFPRIGIDQFVPLSGNFYGQEGFKKQEKRK